MKVNFILVLRLFDYIILLYIISKYISFNKGIIMFVFMDLFKYNSNNIQKKMQNSNKNFLIHQAQDH